MAPDGFHLAADWWSLSRVWMGSVFWRWIRLNKFFFGFTIDRFRASLPCCCRSWTLSLSLSLSHSLRQQRTNQKCETIPTPTPTPDPFSVQRRPIENLQSQREQPISGWKMRSFRVFVFICSIETRICEPVSRSRSILRDRFSKTTKIEGELEEDHSRIDRKWQTVRIVWFFPLSVDRLTRSQSKSSNHRSFITRTAIDVELEEDPPHNGAQFFFSKRSIDFNDFAHFSSWISTSS